MTRSFLKKSALLVYPIMAVYALLIVPIFKIIATDVTLANTLWLDGVDLLMVITEAAAPSIMVALLVAGVYRTGSARFCRALYYLLGGALLLKYVGSIVALVVVHGGALDATFNFGSYAVSLLLDVLPLALATFLTHRYVTTANENQAIRKKAMERLGNAPEEMPDHLPFKKLFDPQNPLQYIAIIALTLIFAIRLLSYIMNEVAYIILGFAFQASDIPVTLLYAFLTVLLPSFIGYLLCFMTTKLVGGAQH